MAGAVIVAVCLVAVLTQGAVAQEADGGFVGLEVQNADGSARAALGFDGFGGVLVREVAPAGPGEVAGVQPGDLIVAFDGVALSGLQQLVGYMAGSAPGQRVSFDIWRHGRRQTLDLTLGDWPAGWRVTQSATAVVPRLGVTLQSLTPEVRESWGVRWGTTGVAVSGAQPDGVAASFGLEPGDVIVAAGRTAVTQPSAVESALDAVGDDWLLLVDDGIEVRLVGPGAPDAAGVVAGAHVLVAALADGPYVMDVAPGGPPVTVAARLQPMPTAVPRPAPAAVDVADLGLRVASLSDETRRAHPIRWSSRGVMVDEVLASSPAQRAGLAKGHIIHSINQMPIETPSDLAEAVAAARANHVLLVVETAQGFRLLPLGRNSTEAGAAPTVAPVFQFGKTPG